MQRSSIGALQKGLGMNEFESPSSRPFPSVEKQMLGVLSFMSQFFLGLRFSLSIKLVGSGRLVGVCLWWEVSFNRGNGQRRSQ